MRLRTPYAVVLGVLLVASSGVTAAQASPTATRDAAARHGGPVVVARGLDNPRQVSITPLGNLLVAEAGSGGDRCYPVDENGNEQCMGTTGSISVVRNPSRARSAEAVPVVSGLLSFAGEGGFQAFGPSGVASNGVGKFYFLPPGAPPVELPPDVDTSSLQTLKHTYVGGTPRTLADFAAFERANDPDQQGFESNPYNLLVLRDQLLIADAAANAVLRWRNGQLSVFAVLPNLQDGGCAGRPNQNGTTGCDAVPTGVAAGPDGAIYVSVLGGPPGTSRVYVMDRNNGQVIREITGLTAVNGLAVGRDGSVYVSQLATAFGPTGPDYTTGTVTRIRPDGTRTDTTVPAPGGLAIHGNNLYVSAWTVSPAGGLPGQPDSDGQVWRLRI